MLVFRCTQKLLARLKQADNLAVVESTTRLGDWYGNILQIGRRQNLLFISERSRLPVVIPIRDGKRVGGGISGRRVRGLEQRRCCRYQHRRRAVPDVGDCVRSDPQPEPARDPERLRFHGAGRERAAVRTRDARGADTVPGADADSPVGRRESDRVDASRVPRRVAQRS
jgi:hypothetical protein